MKRWSIKSKITLCYTMIMLLIVIISFGIIIVIADVTIQRNYKIQLQNVVESNVREVEYDEDDGLEFDEDFVLYQYGVFVHAYDASGNLLLGQNNGITNKQLPFSEEGIYEATVEGQGYYIYDRPVYIQDYGRLWLRGVMAKDEMGQVGAIHTVIKVSFVLLPALVVLAAVSGYLLTKHSFKPVENIINSAEQITEGKDLSRRIGLGEGKDEIYRLANSFDQMFQRLEESFEAEKQFTSDASHELRTPIAVILAQCDYVLEEGASLEEYQEAMEVIERQSYKMSRLINQLLDFTRLERRTQGIQKEPINLSSLVSTICEEQSELRVNDITILSDIEPEARVEGEPMLLTRLLTNLISNAYQYGKEGGHTWVKVWTDTYHVYISVKDDGIGIAEEVQDKVWKRFYRVDSARTSTDNHSSGLGLAMVKQIVLLHHGEVQLRSQLGIGSEFIVRLPK